MLITYFSERTNHGKSTCLCVTNGVILCHVKTYHIFSSPSILSSLPPSPFSSSLPPLFPSHPLPPPFLPLTGGDRMVKLLDASQSHCPFRRHEALWTGEGGGRGIQTLLHGAKDNLHQIHLNVSAECAGRVLVL